LEIKALNSCHVIYVHSESIRRSMAPMTSASVVVITGAIDPMKFDKPSLRGEKIAWVGTPVERKRPELFLEVVKNNPDLRFKLFGKNWMESKYSNRLGDLNNLEYVEIDRAMCSRDFDGCRILLVTSRIEGGPIPVMEALASGVFPIGTNTGFLEDLQQIADLPISFIPANLEGISSALRSKLNEPGGIPPASRERILGFDFERLAGIIRRTLVEDM
jgi:glycosyltransferase involved in cell wall biosynthesis